MSPAFPLWRLARHDKLITSFLKDDDYLAISPNDYNALGLGTTQLYNYQIVYNHKRHRRFELGGQLFEFHGKPCFPKKATAEFLLVDLLNNLNQLAEDRDAVLARVRAKVSEMDAKRLSAAAKSFAKVATRLALSLAGLYPKYGSSSPQSHREHREIKCLSNKNKILLGEPIKTSFIQ